MNNVNQALITYYLRIFESFSLFDSGQMDAREALLEELDALWLSMSEDERAASKVLSKKARNEYSRLKGGDFNASHQETALGGTALVDGKDPASPYPRGTDFGKGSVWPRRTRVDVRTTRLWSVDCISKGTSER